MKKILNILIFTLVLFLSGGFIISCEDSDESVVKVIKGNSPGAWKELKEALESGPYSEIKIDGIVKAPEGAKQILMRSRYLDIKGKSGANHDMIDANGKCRIFYLEKESILTIDKVTLKGGNADKGGCAYVKGSEFIINSGIVRDNTATDAGGGLYLTDEPREPNVYSMGTLTMNGGIIKSNNASNGGKGVYCHQSTGFQISGSAQVASDNDIQLSYETKIEVLGKLTSIGTVATITPSFYSGGEKILKTSNGVVLNQELADKFDITPKNGVNWHIDGKGKLQQE